MTEELFFQCPHCWEEISMIFDKSVYKVIQDTIAANGQVFSSIDSYGLAENFVGSTWLVDGTNLFKENNPDMAAEIDALIEEVASVRAMIVSGPPGIGKSYGVEKALEKQNMFEDIAGTSRKFEVVKGAMSAIGLYKKLYEHSTKGHVVCFDDCDAILYDDLALNLLKAALDTTPRRTLHWNTESRTLMAEGMPNSFEFHGGVIFITNIKFDNVKSKKLQDHLQALQSRCHYLDLTIDSMRDRMLRIKQICRQGMLEKYAMPKETEADLIQFIIDNKHKLREISLRMVLKIADLWKMSPDKYKLLAENTCMKPERELQ